MSSAIQRQGDIVAAIMLRDIRTRFGKSRLGYFWAFAEPLAHMAWISAVSYFLARKAPYGFSREVFVASGLLPLFVFIRVSTKVTSAVSSLSGLRGLSIGTLDLALARAILETLTLIAVMVVVFCVLSIVMGYEEAWPQRLDMLIVSLISFLFLGIGIGFICGVIARFFPMWKIIWSALARVTILLSGVVRIIDYMPPAVREIAYYVPMLHGVTLARIGFYGDSYPQLILDTNYLFGFIVVALFIGLAADRAFRHRLTR